MLFGWMLASTTTTNEHHHVAARLLLVVLLAACVWRCQERNMDWANADSLYAAALQVCPESARINNNIGTRYESVCVLCLTTNIVLGRTDADFPPFRLCGSRLLRGGRAADSVPFFDTAVQAVPTFSLALHNRWLIALLCFDRQTAIPSNK